MTDRVAVFDLDGTLTWRDTLAPFLGRYLLRNPRRLLRVSRLLPALLVYMLRRDRGRLKGAAIRALLGGTSRAALDHWAADFVDGLSARGVFRPAALVALEAHRAAGDHLVLLSASPDLYVPLIARLLQFERVLCTEIVWSGDELVGDLKSPNRRGAEKSRCLEWLRAQYPGMPISAYGNSDSDIVHLRAADRALLVNGNASARRAATAAGIPLANWED